MGEFDKYMNLAVLFVVDYPIVAATTAIMGLLSFMFTDIFYYLLKIRSWCCCCGGKKQPAKPAAEPSAETSSKESTKQVDPARHRATKPGDVDE